jgi:hypothetical protein
MGWLKQESAYDRRLRELEEEADRIRKNMQVVMKNMNRRGPDAAIDRPPAKTTFTPRSSVKPSWQGEVDLSSDSRATATAVAEAEIDGAGEIDASKPIAVAAYGSTPLIQEKRQPQLASYLASGSFGKRGSLARERRIQRNKAIFMLLFALLAIFSLWSWFK